LGGTCQPRSPAVSGQSQQGRNTMATHTLHVDGRDFVLSDDDMFCLNGVQKTRWTIREDQVDAYWQMGTVTLPRRARVAEILVSATARISDLIRVDNDLDVA
jgi:hypothetical protein